MDAHSPGGSPELDRPERVDAIIEFLTPIVRGIVERLEGEEFSTAEFISIMLTDPPAAAAYQAAIQQWGESEHYGKMVIHGQVIPAALRRSTLVQWIGFAHGEADAYAVPARWRLLGPAAAKQ
jgi:hypothetical protein